MHFNMKQNIDNTFTAGYNSANLLDRSYTRIELRTTDVRVLQYNIM